ncbi:hypothetical protein FHX37_3662 [Haloactinospora alba]|uniref:Uncharacterized protein n=1 Tax=Haloactinospora alba TaxID=405555 RepID=A0A543N937_9ACTN|nr:hypothetical protein [Haloactinospora alba]TQN28328.1 hypothetical protein FHX37_3662 [Haloactinospora alba]
MSNSQGSHAREISRFLEELRSRSQRPVMAPHQDNSDLLAWKTNLLERIADASEDPHTHVVAASARADLAAYRARNAALRAEYQASLFEVLGGDS